ncbi:MAG: sodium-translocating pyrophosphatase [Candidatus Omnitrophota bacterium]
MNIYLGIPIIICIIALIIAIFFAKSVMKEDGGTAKMREISGFIREGAMTFMLEEARVMIYVLVVVAAILLMIWGWETAVSFILGAVCAGLAGFIGMNMATNTNVRTAQAAKKGSASALRVAFSGGAVMGISVGSLALLGLCIVIWVFKKYFDPANIKIEDVSIPWLSSVLGRNINFIRAAIIVSAYSMGASLVALFDRVGGGIYTKAADMAADLVGKVESNIPEDDPRNPAVIADNVGDNVGDVGGLGADLLESFVGSIIAVIVIFLYIFVGRNNPSIREGLLPKFGLLNFDAANFGSVVFLPIMIVSGGILSCLLGIIYVRLSKCKNIQQTLMNGTILSAVFTSISSFFIVKYISPSSLTPFWAVLMGLGSGILIGKISEYYTSCDFRPVKELAVLCDQGAGISLAGGLALGMRSCFWPMIIICLATIWSYHIGGLAGVTYTSLGMLAFVVMTVSVDTYGPIADNAGGIAQMANLDKSVRDVTDNLDAVGNTTAAIGKGFAIGSAAFAALGLIAAYIWSSIGHAEEITLPIIYLISPQIGAYVIAGFFLGAMIPYAFSSLLISSVVETAHTLIEEIRRQFKTRPLILEGKELPDYNKCISIASGKSLKKMIVPALIALLSPLVIGFVLGRSALAGFLIGALLSAINLAIQFANTGGALDNAKKYIEEGNFGGKGSKAHAAGVIGDTFGDPLKDTVGPSLDILIKLMAVISLLFASLFPIMPIFFK